MQNIQFTLRFTFEYHYMLFNFFHYESILSHLPCFLCCKLVHKSYNIKDLHSKIYTVSKLLSVLRAEYYMHCCLYIHVVLLSHFTVTSVLLNLKTIHWENYFSTFVYVAFFLF